MPRHYSSVVSCCITAPSVQHFIGFTPLRAHAIANEGKTAAAGQVSVLRHEHSVAVSVSGSLQWRRGAATDETEARELAKALCATGIVLRFRQNVFLRPEEVMQSVLRVSAI